MKLINKLLRLWNWKLIRRSNTYDLFRESYQFPMKAKGCFVIDRNGKHFYQFSDEEVARLCVRILNENY